MFPDSAPYVKYSNGDGTVNDRSLMACEKWNSSKWHFDHKFVTGGEHLGIMADVQFIKYVKDILKLK